VVVVEVVVVDEEDVVVDEAAEEVEAEGDSPAAEEDVVHQAAASVDVAEVAFHPVEAGDEVDNKSFKLAATAFFLYMSFTSRYQVFYSCYPSSIVRVNNRHHTG
jgi:hypothetical protein